MAYRYKTTPTRKPRFNVERLERIRDEENLTGAVQGFPASDLEERFAKALYKLRLAFEFQASVPKLGSLPGEENEVDFVVYGVGSPRPIEIDGEFAHKTSGQKGKDALRDALLNPVLNRLGWNSITRVPYTRLQSERDALRAAREVLL